MAVPSGLPYTTGMLIGPLDPVELDKLKSILDQHSSVYHVTVDEDLLAQEQEEHRRRPGEVTGYPMYKGIGRFLYLEIEPRHALLIRGEVEKMGLSIGSRPIQPEPEADEFLCPECDRVSATAGSCPDHDTVLLPFSDWVRAKKKERMSSRQWFAFCVVVVILLIFLWDHMSRSA